MLAVAPMLTTKDSQNAARIPAQNGSRSSIPCVGLPWYGFFQNEQPEPPVHIASKANVIPLYAHPCKAEAHEEDH